MLLSRDGEPVKVLGTGRQMVAPLLLDDVVEAILRAVENGLCGTFELSGPDHMSLDDLARLLNRDPHVSIRHLADRLATFLTKIGSGLPAGFVDVMVTPSVGNPAAATRQFRLQLHSLVDVWNTPAEAMPDLSVQSTASVAELPT
jgi:hypothetical protein